MGKKQKRSSTGTQVETPWLYVVIFGLAVVLCAGLFALAVYEEIPQPKPENLETRSLRFQSWELEHKDRSTSLQLRLYAADDPKPFTLDFFEGYDRWIPDPARLCDGRTYQVEAQVFPERCDIYAITAPDGTPILTYEDYLQGYWNSQGVYIIILQVFSLVGMIYFALGIVFTLRPEKFPCWMWRLYYKRSALR